MKSAGLFVLLLFAGCASPSTRLTANAPSAVSEVGADVYRIDLAPQGRRDACRAEDLALLRASQLAIEKGFSHFAIVDIGHAATASPLTAPANLQRANPGVYGIYGVGGHNFDVPQMTSGTRQITVQCLNDPPPELMASNARNIEKSIREKYGWE